MRIELLRVENYLAPLFWFRDSFDSTSDVHENPVLTGFFMINWAQSLLFAVR